MDLQWTSTKAKGHTLLTGEMRKFEHRHVPVLRSTGFTLLNFQVTSFFSVDFLGNIGDELLADEKDKKKLHNTFQSQRKRVMMKYNC